MLKLWLVRHGETASNASGTFQGQLDVPLNERGEEQARHLARLFATQKFAAIYSSDLQRASRTAELIAIPHQMTLTTDARLRERHYGLLQGKTYAQAEQLLAGGRSAGEGGIGSTTMPGGESISALRRRARAFADDLLRSHPEASATYTLLIVSHGGLLRVLLTHLLGLPPRARERFAFANCGLTCVAIGEFGALLQYHNWTPWLNDASE